MQTWEYSPEFTIRTYAFVLPFWPLCRLLSLLGYSKVSVFFGVKFALGQGFAWAAARYLRTVGRLCGGQVQLYATAFLLSAPGIFFSATAFLPSAACSSLVMAAVSSWTSCEHPRQELSGYLVSIFFGCLAVVASGW
jgi:alpha-1,2-mannosyltransferase